MKKSNIIISDITCMKEKYCIAGFDTYENRMKRLMVAIGIKTRFQRIIVK